MPNIEFAEEVIKQFRLSEFVLDCGDSKAGQIFQRLGISPDGFKPTRKRSLAQKEVVEYDEVKLYVEDVFRRSEGQV